MCKLVINVWILSESLINLKGSEAKWANPELNVGNCLKSSKMTKNHTLYSTKMPKFSIFYTTAHETHFKHVFKIQGTESTFVG